MAHLESWAQVSRGEGVWGFQEFRVQGLGLSSGKPSLLYAGCKHRGLDSGLGFRA